jgi:hypothetical protein
MSEKGQILQVIAHLQRQKPLSPIKSLKPPFSGSTPTITIDQILPFCSSLRAFSSNHKYLDNHKSRSEAAERKTRGWICRRKSWEKIHSSENWIYFMAACLRLNIFMCDEGGAKLFRKTFAGFDPKNFPFFISWKILSWQSFRRWDFTSASLPCEKAIKCLSHNSTSLSANNYRMGAKTFRFSTLRIHGDHWFPRMNA